MVGLQQNTAAGDTYSSATRQHTTHTVPVMVTDSTDTTSGTTTTDNHTTVVPNNTAASTHFHWNDTHPVTNITNITSINKGQHNIVNFLG